MWKKSIVWRLFIIIILLLTIFLMIGYGGQTFFFERFYTSSKVDNMKNELGTFTAAYEKGDWDNATIQKKISAFYQRTNSQIAILDRNGTQIYGENYHIVVETNQQQIEIPLNSIIYSDESEVIHDLQLKKGAEIYVEGELNDTVLMPSFIMTNSSRWRSAQTIQTNVKLTGRIVGVTLPDETGMTISNQVGMFNRAIYQWLSTVGSTMLTDRVYVEEYVDSVTGLKNKIFIRPIIRDGEVPEIIFSMISLQPIGEAVEIVQRFYLYTIGILLVFSVFFAFYLSKYLARSFHKINRVTTKMAELDFSETIEVTSEDEIGSLSRNINQLSKNLKENIEKLQIANEKLQADIEKERQLEDTRKEFISGVSHELKTPLSIVKSYSEAIKDGITKENTDYYVDVILQEAEKMNGLIVDMLELAKLESGTYSIRKETFSIIELIDDVNYKLMFTLQDKDMDIDVKTDDDYMVVGDKRRIEQVLTNFITNAVRYGLEDTTIFIRLIVENQQLKICVENEGGPISEELMEKIWDRFYRINSARTRSEGGTGLGLSIVKNILELHQVDFGVYNEEGWVVFYFYLPLKETDEGAI